MSYYTGAFSIGVPLTCCFIWKITIIFWNFRFYLWLQPIQKRILWIFVCLSIKIQQQGNTSYFQTSQLCTKCYSWYLIIVHIYFSARFPLPLCTILIRYCMITFSGPSFSPVCLFCTVQFILNIVSKLFQ